MSLKKIIKNMCEMSYKEVVSDYDEYHIGIWDNHPLPKRADIFSSWIEEGTTLLDIGCGDGTITEYLKEKNNLTIFGMDMIDVPKKTKFPFKLADLDAKKIEINGQYDNILMSDVIEHLKFPHNILVEASKHTNNLMVSIPNGAWWVYRLQLFFGHVQRESFTHLHSWSIKDFKQFCNEIGLEVTKYDIERPNSLIGRFFVAIFPNVFGNAISYSVKRKENFEEIIKKLSPKSKDFDFKDTLKEKREIAFIGKDPGRRVSLNSPQTKEAKE